MENEKNDDFVVWVVVIIVVIFIVAYVLSLGKIKIPQQPSIIPEEFKDNQIKAKQRYERLKNLIDKKIELKSRLEKWFKRIYFVVRLLFLALWGVYLFILFKFNLIQNLGDALNYSEAAILFGLALNFLTFGSISNLNSFIDQIKIKVKNWVWGKKLNIEFSIEANTIDLNETAALVPLISENKI